jgi:ectoine hydroxylase-related dioxygenase (phytanoyl-CoA dioxygenase family)
MVTRYSDADIESMHAFYAAHGAVRLPGLLDAQTVTTILETINASAAHAESGKAPGQDMSFGRAEGRMTIRYMWRAIPAIRDFLLQPGLAEPIARIVGTKRLQFWFDLTFLHNGSTQGDAGAGTPWHHDGSAFHFKGTQLPSLWMAMTQANAQRSRLKFIDGSHRTAPGFYRTSDNPAPADGSKDGFLDVPDFDAMIARGEEKVLTWDCEPGDAIIIHPMTVHGADGNKGGAGRRVAITTRWLGDDVRFLPTSYAKAMKSTGLEASELVIGGRPKGDWFPVVWDQDLSAKAR